MHCTHKIPLLVITGPTAAGKTALALRLAQQRGIEIISADSRQVYRKMDIGTAKATREEQEQARHHCIDVVDVDESFSVADFAVLAQKAVADIYARGLVPVVVGGTGLYIRALTQGLAPLPGADEERRREWHELEKRQKGSVHALLAQVDPLMAKGLHINDVTRIIRALEVYAQTGRTLSSWQHEHQFGERPYTVFKVAVTCERQQLYERIEQRVDQMFAHGLLEESQALLDAGYDPELKAMRTIGYQQSCDYLRGLSSFDEAVRLIKRDTRRYAKRQLTWLRRDSEINWLETPFDFDKINKWLDEILCICRCN